VVARADSLLQQIAPGVMVTMLYLLIDSETLDARIVNAGHPPLVLLDREGARFAGAATAPPMGFNPFPRYAEAVEHLRPASTMLLYTDGLIDRPDLPIDVGMERLRAFLSENGNLDLDRLCERVLSELVQGELNDDIALLAVRAIPASAEPLRLRIPAVPQELAHVRLALSRWLAASGVPPGSAEDVVLASSEACANAVKHAYGPSHGEVDLDAEVRDGSVIVSVRDFGRWRPGHADDGGRGLGLIDSCMSSVSIERGPEGTEVRMRRVLDAEGTG
jgi:anti-sigma regulatory factor (Ser/Thr protein kinase)